MKKINLKLYITALIFTVLIFSTAFFISGYINTKKTEELKASEDKIAVDILSFETEFDLAKKSSCADFDDSSVRSGLDSLASKLNFMEGQLGSDNPEVFRLKRYYSLLQIRDYLLTNRMNEQCNFHTIFVIDFYSKLDNCQDCQTQEYILQAIHDEYPNIEIYSFDYNADSSAIKTLTTIHDLPKTPPFLSINGKYYAPFSSLSDMEGILAPLLKLQASTTEATSSQKTTTSTLKKISK